MLFRPAVSALAAVALFSTVITCRPVGAQEAADEEWSIEASRAPATRTLDFVATEGTWMSVDVSPDGRRIAFDLLGHIYEMPIEGGQATALTEGRSWNMFPRYSPDGSKLAFTSDRSGSEDVWVLHLEDDSLENVSEMDEAVVQGSWSADGRGIYATVFDPNDAKTRGHRFNLHGDEQRIAESGVFQPLNHFVEDPGRHRVLYEHNDENLFEGGARIKAYDLETGETEVYRERPGGAFNPAITPDGRYLAYGHRDDQETVLVLHDLETRAERVLVRGLDRDHQEYGPYYYGVAPNVDWGPDGREIFLAFGGKIRAVAVETGEQREIPFQARVQRELDTTIRFPVEVPEGRDRTHAHRWAHRTDTGILFETLGDIYLKDGGSAPRNLTDSPEHETSPIYDPGTGNLYYAAWSDAELGHLYRRPLDAGARTRLTDVASQYSSLALSPDGGTLAFVRGRGDLRFGGALEEETEFELVVIGPDGVERRVADLSGSPNFSSRLPLTVLFGPEGEHLYYTEFLSDTLTLQRIRTDGVEKTTLYRFPHAVRAVPSPDLKWIAFREYHRSFVTPFEYIGQTVTISAFDGEGFTRRVDEDDGVYMAWSPDGRTLTWSRSGRLYEKDLDAILAEEDGARATEIAVEFEVATPSSTVALTNVRVLTMNPGREVLEGATILVRGNRIRAVGPDVEAPADARVYDLTGHTVMPGLVDAHGHYGSRLSQTQVIEGRLPGLAGALAHGVTTLYELYGTAEKDFWVTDMVRAGKMAGPRLFSVGSPIYGSRFFRPKLYRPIRSLEEAKEHARYNQEYGATELKDYVNFRRAERHQLMTAVRELGINVVSETAGDAPMNFTQIVDGVTGLEHSPGLTPLYQDVIELFRASDVGVTPTLLVVYNGPSGQAYFNQSVRVWEDEKLLNFARKDQLLSFRRVTHYWPDDLYAPEMASEMKKLFDAGVLVNMGGHGQMLGRDAHWELELFVQGGFAPLEAIQTATINAATYHGLDADLGSIEPGKLADLVVMSENPLEDIGNTKAIVLVMKNGVLYEGEDAARVYPDPEPAAPIYYQRDPGMRR